MGQLPESLNQIMEQYSKAVELIKNQSQQFKQINEHLEYMENQQPVNPVIITFLLEQRKKLVTKLLGGKGSPAYQDRKLSGAVYREAANDFKKHYKIPRYDLLKKEDQESALKFWSGWKPCLETTKRINEVNGVS